ncbi:MAG: hypothetical protein RMJ34_02815 [candidate division WOR-3 bacterium]|nr:hypothetical protein [candidate division WOR-3 bacterium]MDW8113852.1 hypothetical protein [candidate division WOR-3 bacterium]
MANKIEKYSFAFGWDYPSLIIPDITIKKTYKLLRKMRIIRF